jgi:hypothetical protein
VTETNVPAVVEAEPALTPEVPPAPEASTVVADQESSAVPDESIDIPPTAALQPVADVPAFDGSSLGHITIEPQATSISEEILQQVTLEMRWEYATRAEQEAFVAEHRVELHKMLAKIDR